MKRTTALLLILFFSVSVEAGIVKIKGGASYFYPQSKNLRDIYGSAGICFGGDLEYSLFPEMGLWLGAGYYSKKGLLSYTEEETTLLLLPIHGGVKVRMPGNISPYLGIGAVYYIYREENVIGEVSGGGLGAVAQCGCLFRITGPLFVDFQLAYFFCQVEPEDFKEHIGGIHAVLSLGVDF
jgi:hypothetical protein